MKYRIEYSTTFKRSYKLAKKRGLPMDELNDVVQMLAEGRKLALSSMTISLWGVTKAAASATSSPTGCSYTALRNVSKSSTSSIQALMLTCSGCSGAFCLAESNSFGGLELMMVK